VPFCAELAAGFTVPRPPAEILGGDATAVWAGSTGVVENTGNDDRTPRPRQAGRQRRLNRLPSPLNAADINTPID